MKKYSVLSFVLISFFATQIFSSQDNLACLSFKNSNSEALNFLLEDMLAKYEDSDSNNGFQLAILNDEDEVVEKIVEILREDSKFRLSYPSERFVEKFKKYHGSFDSKPELFEQFLIYPNKNGDTVFHLAASKNKISLLSDLLLLSSEIEPLESLNKNSETPLHVAAKIGHLDLMKFLLKNRANNKKKSEQDCKKTFGLFNWGSHYLLNTDINGRTILDIAIEKNDEEMRSLIESFVYPISKRCKIPKERFAQYRSRLDYLLDKAESFLETEELEIRKVSEIYLLEDLSGVKYLTKEELQNHHVSPFGGKLLTTLKKSNAQFICFHKFIYVMSTDGKLFLACPEIGTFHHSSFFRGKEVLGAGHLELKDGIISDIDNSSGHYQPTTRQLIQTAFKLYDQGVLNDETRIQFVTIKISLTMKEFLEALALRNHPIQGICENPTLAPGESLKWQELIAPDFCTKRTRFR